ncbi:hypothetical protein CVIRNUC_005258 [Coccomyxa viridis]|uniref:Photolyase/cryptochrome alpha/beta domain-containing protein n=1 Tax=Coccomyxa viridis TaxID=1274662 RepID=A0AAV1I6G4_9CHLO|nr:hypothetical protein CVIRNUC_005258 [Coccomyxa viridis]
MSGNGAGALSGPSCPPSAPPFQTVVLWFRRDLRVSDNPALIAAVQAAANVIPVYVWAPEEEGLFKPGRCSRWWLHQSLKAFEKDLAALGTSMVYRRSRESCISLVQLVQETGAQALFLNHLYDPISLVRDTEVKAAMCSLGVHCQSFNGDVLYEPWEVLAESARPFTSFATFWSRVQKMPYPPPIPLPVPTAVQPRPDGIPGLTLDALELMSDEEAQSNEQLYHSWSPGGKGAHTILERFVSNGLRTFNAHRAKTDRQSTSSLSPHVHFGEISTRHIFYVVKRREARQGAHAAEWAQSTTDFLRQMGYREYARYLSFHFPFTHERSLLEHVRAAPWRYDQSLFKAWRQGRTGYPLVDAGMRQLWSSGWLHNRIRVVCASFLVKNLLLPWQWGLKHYWDALLDADLECAALGWQFVSGCLADAHSFDYMLVHSNEAKVFDPDGNYVRRWLPVLGRMPAKWIHRPWEAPEHMLADAGVELGVNYPLPVISIEESEEALAQAMATIQESLVEVNDKNPFRPASDPSVLKASRGTPAPTAPSSVHMPAKRARGEDAAAREAAGEFTAAAARARQPDHQAYDQAEHAAGLAGQGAQQALDSGGRIAGNNAEIPESKPSISNGRGPAFPNAGQVQGSVLATSAANADVALSARRLSPGAEEVVSNNVSAAREGGPAGGTSGIDSVRQRHEPQNDNLPAQEPEAPSAEAVVPSVSEDAVVPRDVNDMPSAKRGRHL